MGHKKKIIGGIVAAMLYFVIANLLFEYTKINETPILFLLVYSMAVFICLIILYFLPEQALNSWWKFARIYVPISAVVVAIMPTSNGFMGFYSSDKEYYTWLVSVLFVLISLVLIVRAHRRLKRQDPSSPPPVQKIS